MDKELKPSLSLYSVAAAGLAVLLSLGLVVVLGTLLFGCATVRPYRGGETQPSSYEEFVKWENIDEGLAVKNLFIDNPLNVKIRAHFECGTPVDLDVDVPARSTRVESIYDYIRGPYRSAPDSCRLTHYDVIR